MKLTRAEREVLLRLADDEQEWHVYTDSARLTRRLLRIAGQWKTKPERLGEGYEFNLPLKAVRFSGPSRRSERQREAARESIQKARFAKRSVVGAQAGTKSPGPKVC